MLIYIQSCLYLILHFTKYSVYLTQALACNSYPTLMKNFLNVLAAPDWKI